MTDGKKSNKKINNNIRKIYQLTPLQEGMLFESQLAGGGQAYFVQQLLRFSGCLRTDILQRVLRLLEVQHEVLKTAIFYRSVKRPRQVIVENRHIGWALKDFTDLPQEQRKDQVLRSMQDDLRHGFDLEREPLLRLTVMKTAPEEHYLLWSFHHIIMDGWCMGIVMGDFMTFYRMLDEGMDYDVLLANCERQAKGRLCYSDYIKWLTSRDLSQGMEYWKNYLADYTESVTVPVLIPPEQTDEQVCTLTRSLSDEAHNLMAQCVQRSGVTRSTIIETAFGLLLQHYNHTRDAVFGKVVSGRGSELPGVESVVGLFVNTVPMRISTEDDPTCEKLLQRAAKSDAESTEFEYCPLSEIQMQSAMGRELIRTLYVYENFFVDEDRMQSGGGGTQVESLDEREQTGYGLTLKVTGGQVLSLVLMYDPRVYHPKDMERAMTHLEGLICVLCREKDMPVSAISLLTEEERENILGGFNATETEYPESESVAALFERQVEKTPAAPAVVFHSSALTYGELNRKANALAARLRALGIGPDSFVAVMAKRGMELFVGIYAVLKAGGAYVPIDPELPPDRVEFMLEDCRPGVMLYAGVQPPQVEGMLCIDLTTVMDEEQEENPAPVSGPEDLAYCIFTSGTTGRPKGVMVKQKNVVNYSYDGEFAILHPVLELGCKRIASVTNISFDIFVTEAIASLLNGMTVCVADEREQEDPVKFAEFIVRNGVEVVQTTPSRVKLLLASPSSLPGIQALRALLMGGEAVDSSTVAAVEACSDAVIIDVYGPSETTVWSTMAVLPRGVKEIPIGRPISNTQIYILDGMKLCGVGVPGELCIAGDGVARGYLKREDLTREKFIDNPYGSGKLYRTGDLAMWRADGNLMYLGRIDEQVKVRGYRIELGEVESVLRKQDGVKAAAVVVKRDKSGEAYLAAYYVGSADAEALKAGMRQVLPGYMVPGAMMCLETLPVNRSGKLDKRALPDIEVHSTVEYVAPQTETEAALCDAFAEILGLERVGVKDNFFELGGNSIKAIRVISYLRGKGLELRMEDIMHNATAADVAACMANPERGGKKESRGTWDALVEEYGRSEEMKAETALWERIAAESAGGGLHLRSAAAAGQTRIVLDEAVTEVLLREAARPDGAGTEALLLSALSMTIQEMTGQQALTVMIKKHGGETLFGGHAEGPFTGLYPLVLHAGESVKQTVLDTAQRLGQIPMGGIGYGVMLKRAGQMPPVAAETLFELRGARDGEAGRQEAFSGSDTVRLSISGSVDGTQVRLDVGYGENTMTPEEAERFAAAYRAAAAKIAAACEKLHTYTVTEAERAQIEDAYRACDHALSGAVRKREYPLSLLQQGFVHSDRFQLCSVQFIVEGYTIRQVSDAVGKVIREQPAMRTAFDPETERLIEYTGGDWAVPVLAGASGAANQQLLEAVSALAGETAYYIGGERLLVKTLLLPLGERRIAVRCYAQHVLWDGESYKVLEKRVYAYLRDPNGIPLDFTEEEKTDAAGAQRAQAVCRQFIADAKAYVAEHDTRPKVGLTGLFQREELRPEILQNPVEVGIKFMHGMATLGGYRGTLPVLVMHHNRTMKNSRKLGLFADLMPVQLPLDRPADEAAEVLMRGLEQLQEMRFSSNAFRHEMDPVRLSELAAKLPQVNIVFEAEGLQMVGLSREFDGGDLDAVVAKGDQGMYSLQMNVSHNHVMILAAANGTDYEGARKLLNQMRKEKVEE